MGVDIIFLLSIMLIIFVMLLFIVFEDRRKILCMEKEARKLKMEAKANASLSEDDGEEEKKV